MNLGFAYFYSFHEMCLPYVIAGVYGFNKDDVEAEFNALIGLDRVTSEKQKEWFEYSIVRIDCTKHYHTNELGLELPYDHTRAFKDWAPYLQDSILVGSPGSPFTWKFYDGDATRFEWMNRYHRLLDQTLSDELRANVIKRKERK